MKKTSEEVVAVVVTATEEVVVVAETEKKTVQIQEEAKTEEPPKLGKVFNEMGKTPIRQKSGYSLFLGKIKQKFVKGRSEFPPLLKTTSYPCLALTITQP